MATNCQAVNLSSADNSSQFSSGQTMLQGVPISMDVVIVLLATLEAATAVPSKDTGGLFQVIKDVPLRLTLENSASNISS
jgi:hypothetical protein